MNAVPIDEFAARRNIRDEEILAAMARHPAGSQILVKLPEPIPVPDLHIKRELALAFSPMLLGLALRLLIERRRAKTK